MHKLTLPLEREWAKVKAKSKVRARADILFAHHICDQRTVVVVKRDIGQMIANVRMSSSSLSTHTYCPYGDATTSFHSSEPGRSVLRSQRIVTIPFQPHIWLVKNVPLPTEATEQLSSTPTASATIDIKNTAIFDDSATDDNDEPWATEADHRTGWNETFKSGTCRGMLCGIVLRDCPKQVVLLTKAKSVFPSMSEFLGKK